MLHGSAASNGDNYNMAVYHPANQYTKKKKEKERKFWFLSETVCSLLSRILPYLLQQCCVFCSVPTAERNSGLLQLAASYKDLLVTSKIQSPLGTLGTNTEVVYLEYALAALLTLFTFCEISWQHREMLPQILKCLVRFFRFL